MKKCGLYFKGFGNRKNIVIESIAFLVVLSIALMIGSGCGAAGISRLQPVEIKEYQGEKLSSINDFRENSIKGPQHVNIQSYRMKISGLVENPKEYTYDEVIDNHQSYEKVVKLDCVEGWRSHSMARAAG